MITIYTDGSSRGNPGPGGWGAIIFHDNVVKEVGGREDHTTNNRMELTATIKSLEFLSKIEPSTEQLEAEIHTDSEYVIKGMTEWVESWQRKGWRTANKKPVLNQDLWQELLAVSLGKKIEWKHVAGHAGHKQNERCDEIATAFADQLQPELYDGPRENYRHA